MDEKNIKTLREQGCSENEYIQDIRNIPIVQEKINFIYQEVEKRAKSIFSINYSNDLKIEFMHPSKIDDMNTINATIDTIGEHHVLIKIYPNLIKELIYHARFVASYSKIFTKIDRTNVNEVEILVDYIVFLYLDFILLHEFQHVILGHLNYNILQDFKLNEIEEDVNIDLSEEQISIIKAMEVEADYYAIKGSYKFFDISKENLYKHLNKEEKEETLYYDYFHVLHYLYEWFMKYNQASILHPTSKERIYMINEALLSNLNFKYVGICMSSFIKYMENYYCSVEQFMDMMNECSVFLDNMNKIREKYLMNKKNGYKIGG